MVMMLFRLNFDYSSIFKISYYKVQDKKMAILGRTQFIGACSGTGGDSTEPISVLA